MRRYTVWWHPTAEDDLAVIWMKSRFRKRLTETVLSIEAELTERAESIGSPHRLSQLDLMSIDILLKRFKQLPEDLRIVDLGPCIVEFFVIREEGLVVVARLLPGPTAF
jgi:hypothetical protein